MSRNGLNNKGGRPKGSKSNHTLQAEKARAFLILEVQKNIAPIAAALIRKAKDGDVAAIKELFDRSLGKAPQPLEGGGEAMALFTLLTDDQLKQIVGERTPPSNRR